MYYMCNYRDLLSVVLPVVLVVLYGWPDLYPFSNNKNLLRYNMDGSKIVLFKKMEQLA